MSTLPPELRHRAQRLADTLLAQLDDPQAAVVVATEDGFDLAHAVRSGATAFDARRVAAMTSSISAIGEVVGRETGLGRTESLVAEVSGGYVLMRSIDADGTRLLLAAMCSRRLLLGLVVHSVNGCLREWNR